MLKGWRVLLLVGLLVLAGSAWGSSRVGADTSQRQLDLEGSLKLATTNNGKAKLLELALEKAKLALEQAQFNANRIQPEDITVYPGTTSTRSAYTKYVAPLKAKADLAVAEKNASVYQDSLNLQVRKAYYDVFKARRERDNGQAALERAQEQLRLAKVRLEAGTAAKVEVSNAEGDVAGKQAALSAAIAKHEMAVMAFDRLLGLPLDTALELKEDDFSFQPLENLDLPAAIAKALEKSSDVTSAQTNLPVAEENMKQVTKFFTPNVFTYRQAEYDLESARLFVTEARATTELKARQAYVSLQAAADGYLAYQKSLEAAKEMLRVTNLQYEVGLATQIQAEQAADTVAGVEAKLVGALYDYNLAKAQLLLGIYN